MIDRRRPTARFVGRHVQGRALAGAAALIVAVACTRGPAAIAERSDAFDTGAALQSITPQDLRRHIDRISSDEFGVVAPEYGWDDYKDVDVRGKTIVVLINDPAVPAADEPSRLDERMFNGRAMTYYGRWTYKYEIAAKKGAAAAVIVHEIGPAGYPYEVVSGSWGRENFEIRTPDRNMDRVPIEAWIQLDRAMELLAAAGSDFERLKRAATRRDFRPVPLPARATFRLTNTIREIESHVVARLEGSDPRFPERKPGTEFKAKRDDMPKAAGADR